MRRCFPILALVLAAGAHAQPPPFVNPAPGWVQVATGPGHAAVRALASTGDYGGARLIAVGTFEQTLAFPGGTLVAPEGTTASFVRVMEPFAATPGALRWQRRLASLDGGDVVAVAAHNAYLGLESPPTGEALVVVAGWATGRIALDGGGAPDATLSYEGEGAMGFVAAYSPEGDLRWARRVVADGGEVRPTSLATMWLPDGGSGTPVSVLLVGGDFSGTAVWEADATSASAGGTDGFVLRLNAGGSVRDVRTLGGAGDDAVNGLVPSYFGAAAGLWAAVTFRDSLDLTPDAPGTQVVSRGGADALAVRFAADLSVLETVHLGGTGDDLAQALAVNYWGQIEVGGTFLGTLSAGDLSVTSAGGTDAFVYRLADLPWSGPGLGRDGSTDDDTLTALAAATSFYGDVFAPTTIVAGYTGGRVEIDRADGTVLQLPTQGGKDGFLASRAPWTYGHIAGTQVGGSGTDRMLAATVVHSWGPLEVVVGGSFQQSARFGTTLVAGHGASDDDAFIAYYPPGTLTEFYVASEPAPAPTVALSVAPNPSRGEAVARLALDAPAAHVTVRVHDALGRTVAVLHNGPLGTGEASFALPAGLAPGRYLVRASGEATASAALTVVR